MNPAFPTIVSFYAGDKYYYDCASLLRQDCQSLGLSHDICELSVNSDIDWAQLCRKKIKFYKKMLDTHPNGILWVDVDTRLLQIPKSLSNAHYDMGAFLRNFKDIRQFDPVLFSRTFHPGFLHFTGSDNCRKFVDHLTELEAKDPSYATDDYFLEEAFRSYPQGLSLHIFNTDMLSKGPVASSSIACFQFGASGNVRHFREKVSQHTAKLFNLHRQKMALQKAAQATAKRGKRLDARVFLREAFRIDKKDKEIALQLARIEMKCGDYKVAMRIVKEVFGATITDLEVVKIKVECLMSLGNYIDAKKFLEEMGDVSAEVEAYRQSRLFRIGLEIRAAKLKLSDEDRPQLWWMETPYPGNLGDILNPYIVEKLSGIPPKFCEPGKGILAIGSVIKFATERSVVWGSGTPRMTDKLSPTTLYKSVRGPLTRELVLASGGVAPEIYGDAAMLLPYIYTPPNRKNRRRVGFIRHLTHISQKIELRNVTEISLSRIGYHDIEKFIREICNCSHIISTSLHGLIIAHAYGIPTRWAEFSQAKDTLPGDGTKFRDHYMAFGIEVQSPLDLSRFEKIDQTFADFCTEVVTKPLNASALLDAAPFPVKELFLQRVRERTKEEVPGASENS